MITTQPNILLDKSPPTTQQEKPPPPLWICIYMVLRPTTANSLKQQKKYPYPTSVIQPVHSFQRQPIWAVYMNRDYAAKLAGLGPNSASSNFSRECRIPLAASFIGTCSWEVHVKFKGWSLEERSFFSHGMTKVTGMRNLYSQARK